MSVAFLALSVIVHVSFTFAVPVLASTVLWLNFRAVNRSGELARPALTDAAATGAETAAAHNVRTHRALAATDFEYIALAIFTLT